MIVKRLSYKNTGIVTALLILIVLSFSFWLSRSAFFLKKPDVLSFAVTMDLVFTVPLIYFIGIRKKKIPNITLVPFLFLMILFGSFIIPAGYHKYLDLIEMIVLPAAELFATGYLILTTRKVISEYKKAGKSRFLYRPEILRSESCSEQENIRNHIYRDCGFILCVFCSEKTN